MLLLDILEQAAFLDYVDEKRNKIAIFAVELKKDKSLEKARSKQRNFIADRIKVMNYDGAIVAFYSADETELRWRLSFVRLDYELLKGKINLECNILCGNSLIDEFEGIKLFNDSLLTGASNNGNWMADLFQDQVDKTLEKLIEKQRELFYANNHDDKYRLKHEIDVLQQQVIFSSCTMTDDVKERVTSAFAMPSKPFILWKLAFAKVFKDKGGFDIVIGNPPYGAKFSAKEKVLLAKKYPTVPDYESADYFLDKSHELLNNVGYVNYIIPNKMIAKKNVKNNRSIGMKSKLALVSIINKNQPVKDIVLELIGYMNVNDLSK